MNNYCLRNWRLVKTGIHSSKNYWKLNDWPFCILRQTNFVRFFKVRSLIKTRYGPCMELSPERVTTTKELSGQKLRKFSCEFCLEPFWFDCTTVVLLPVMLRASHERWLILLRFEFFVLYCETLKVYHW